MNIPYVFPKTLRVLSPAARCASPFDMYRAWRTLEQFLNDDSSGESMQAAVQRYCTELLGVKMVWIAGSGKEALFRTFLALKSISSKPAVGMSAYTCPDVASAAAAAGFTVLPLEINPHSLELETADLGDELLERCAAVVLSNLYGLPDSLAPWQELQAKYEFLLIDDACQAVASRRTEQRVGTAAGTVGILSFGRGKALSGVGGGAIILPNGGSGLGDEFEEMLGRAIQAAEQAPEGSRSVLREVAYCLLQWLFGSPLGYRIPASLPFLGLGKTEADLEVRVKQLSRPAMMQAVAQLHLLERAAEVMVQTAELWQEALTALEVVDVFSERGFRLFEGVVPIRYPLIFPDGPRRDAVLRRLLQEGLGATGSYPAPLQAYPELYAAVEQRPTPFAESAARCILTLPVHRYVSSSDVERAAAIIKEEV